MVARHNEPKNRIRRAGTGYQPGTTGYRPGEILFRAVAICRVRRFCSILKTGATGCTAVAWAGCTFHPFLNRRLIQFCVAFLCCLIALNIEAAEAANNRPAAVWDVAARVAMGGGYRDNVLRTAVAPENSAFFVASADASFIRLSETGLQLTFFVLGEDTRYFNAPSLDYEQLFSGTAQASVPVGANSELGGQFNYLFQHQILDVSETEAALYRVLVDAHALTLRAS